MNANYRLKTHVTFLLLLLATVLVTAGCGAARQSFKKGAQAEISKDYEVAMEQYRQAMIAEPQNIEYRLKYEQTRFSAAYVHFRNGKLALEAGDGVKAKAEFQRAMEIDPSHDFARQELADAERVIQNRGALLDIEKLKAATRTDPNLGAQMKTSLTERISLSFPGTSSRTIFENLAEQAGLQVIFERRFRPAPATIALRDVNIFEALDLVALQTGSFWQPVNETTIFVAEDNQQNRRDLEDHILKTVYLTNVTTTNDLNGILNVLRTALSVRGIFQSEQQNAIVIHDTPARVAMIENVIRALDKRKAEVVIDVTVMEVDRNTLRDLGIQPPTESGVAFNSLRAGGTNEVSIKDLDRIGSGDFSIPINNTVVKFLAQNNNARLLQNPRLRTTDGVTASLRVGSEVPVPTTSIQNNNFGGGAQTSYTMQQVGVQLDIVSKVLLNRDISLQVTVTVRALAGERLVGTINIPVFSNRIVAHTIRLAEGQTNILGGIISETESRSTTGIPGLKDIPFLGFLFGQEHKQRDQAEVIIMLTPHIVGMPDITEEDIRGVIVGGENFLKLRPNYGSPAPLPLPPAAPRPATPSPSSAIPAAPPAPTTATLSFPAPVSLTAQGETPVSLAINGPNILGTELKFAFDPAAFTIKDVRDGGFLSQGNQVIALVHNIDNQRGVATVTLERSPNAPLVTGNGTLVTLMLQPGARKGASPLTVTEFGVRDARQLHPGRSTEVQVTVP